MRHLGIDYGAKNIGLAYSDERESFAFPLETIPNDAQCIAVVQKIVKERGIEHIVVGDARTFSGGKNEVTDEVSVFAKKVEEMVRVPVSLMAEAFSSIEASRFAPRGAKRDDAASAAIILQRFLDMHSVSENKTQK